MDEKYLLALYFSQKETIFSGLRFRNLSQPSETARGEDSDKQRGLRISEFS